MVSPADGEKSHDPRYSLDAIHRLAGFGQIEYRGKKVPRDVAALGLGLEDVCECLQALRAADFAHSVWYNTVARWHDVYKTRYRPAGGGMLDLYIKLRLDDRCIVIELCSFHD